MYVWDIINQNWNRFKVQGIGISQWFFQTKVNLVWNLRRVKSVFFFPNQTGIGLENRTQFLGVTFPNQTGFGLEKDTEYNVVADLQGAFALHCNLM